MWSGIWYGLLRIVVAQIVDRKLVDFVFGNVEWYMKNSELPSEEKKEKVLGELKDKAKEVGVTLSGSVSNFLIETAVQYAKSKLGV